jgi:hypothetical protein
MMWVNQLDQREYSQLLNVVIPQTMPNTIAVKCARRCHKS